MEKAPVKAARLKRVNVGFSPEQYEVVKLAQHSLLFDNTNLFIRESMKLIIELNDQDFLEYKDGKLKVKNGVELT